MVAERLDGFLDEAGAHPSSVPGNLGAFLRELHADLAAALERLGARERTISQGIGRRYARIERLLGHWRVGRSRRSGQ
jgi:hypothetical protein